MKTKLLALLQLLSNKGSKMSELLLPGLSDREIREREKTAGTSYPKEIRDYLSVFGGGVCYERVARDVDTQIMPSLGCMSYSNSLFALKNFENSHVLGRQFFDQNNLNAFPVLTSGGEYISLFWSEGIYSVVWKVSGYGYDSYKWPDLTSLFDHIKECWAQDYYKYDFDNDWIVKDSEGEESLFEKYGVVVEVNPEGDNKQ